MRTILTMLVLGIYISCGLDPQYDIEKQTPKADGDDRHKSKKHPGLDDQIQDSQIYCKVQRIFDNNCIKCHSEKGQQPSLVRGFAQSALIDKKGHHGNYLVKPNVSNESELFNLITSKDASHRMPKNAPPLAKEDIELIRTWIDTGASFTCSQGK